MVDTVLDKILEDDYRYKLTMYQIFLIYESSPVELTFLMEKLEITQFKANQYVEELIQDLEDYLNASCIRRENRTTFIGKNFSQNDYQELRKGYFEKSVKVNLLIQVGILQNFTVIGFAEAYFISKSTAFNIVKRINQYLENWGIYMRANHLVGEESNIRIFCFQFFFYFYGTAIPKFFSSVAVDSHQAELINAIQMIYERSFTLNQLSQLKMFIRIQSLRISQHCLIEKNIYIQKDAPFKSQFIWRFKEISIFLLEEEFLSEANYLQLFLLLNEYIDQQEIVAIPDTEAYLNFVKLIKKRFPLLESVLSNKLISELRIICFKWENFTFSIASFISEEQFLYFQQAFPQIHHLVYEYIKQLKKKNTLAEFERIHFYYDFIFCLLQDEKVRSLGQAIHLFIDFSGGKSYNQFIRMNILSYNYLNLTIDDKLTAKTDIYISDFYNRQVKCHQIIWKSPPLDCDWHVLADTIIQMKEKKNEMSSNANR
ncbi:hypothetical protein FG877_17380 [Enterococcus casseliflavus]|nr:hypothetical protein [Enterococcus casseliflavus]